MAEQNIWNISYKWSRYSLWTTPCPNFNRVFILRFSAWRSPRNKPTSISLKSAGTTNCSRSNLLSRRAFKGIKEESTSWCVQGKARQGLNAIHISEGLYKDYMISMLRAISTMWMQVDWGKKLVEPEMKNEVDLTF